MKLIIQELELKEINDQKFLCYYNIKRLQNLIGTSFFKFILTSDEDTLLSKCFAFKFKNKNRFYLYNLKVEENKQNNGIGKETISQIENYFSKYYKNVEIEIECNNSNKIAYNMYKSLDYKITNIESKHFNESTTVFEKIFKD